MNPKTLQLIEAMIWGFAIGISIGIIGYVIYGVYLLGKWIKERCKKRGGNR